MNSRGRAILASGAAFAFLFAASANAGNTSTNTSNNTSTNTSSDHWSSNSSLNSSGNSSSYRGRVSDYRRDERIDDRPYGPRSELYEFYNGDTSTYFGGPYDYQRGYYSPRDYNRRSGRWPKGYRDRGYRVRGDD